MFYISLIVTGLLAMLAINIVRDVTRRRPRIEEESRTEPPANTTP